MTVEIPATASTTPAVAVELYHSYPFIIYHYPVYINKEILCVRISKHFSNISKPSIYNCFIVSDLCNSTDSPWTESAVQYISKSLLFFLRGDGKACLSSKHFLNI